MNHHESNWAMNHPQVCLHILKPNGLSFFVSHLSLKSATMSNYVPAKKNAKKVCSLGDARF
jgi:hypothetical protein